MASLRSTPPGLLELISVFDASGARALIDSLDAFSVFEAAAVDDYTYNRLERRVEGLDLCTGDLIMCISLGTPY